VTEARGAAAFAIPITLPDTNARPLSFFVGRTAVGKQISIASLAGQTIYIGDASQQNVPLLVPLIFDTETLDAIYVRGNAGNIFYIINGVFQPGTQQIGNGTFVIYAPSGV